MSDAKPLARDVELRGVQTDKISDGRGGEYYPGDNGYLLVERENDEDG